MYVIIGRPRLGWENCIEHEHDVKKVEPDLQWKIAAIDREKWRDICLAVCPQ